MKLGSCVSIQRARAIVLEFRDDPFTGCFRRMISSHSRLNLLLHLVRQHSHTLAVRIPDAFVTTNKSSKRNVLWRAESSIPAGSVLRGFDCFPVFIDIFQWNRMLNDLLTGCRVAPIGEPLKLFFPD